MGRSDRDRDRERKSDRDRDRDRRTENRKRSRSRDREREKRRSRSRDRRSRSTDRKRPRTDERGGEKRKDDKRERKTERAPEKESKEEKPQPTDEERDILEDIVTMEDKTVADSILEKQMEERRLKVEQWRARRMSKAGTAEVKTEPQETEANGEAAVPSEESEAEKQKKKGWSLEDDDEEEEEENKPDDEKKKMAEEGRGEENGLTEQEEQTAAAAAAAVEKTVAEPKVEPPDVKLEEVKKEPEEDEIDPLDAFMMDVKKELAPKNKGGVRIVTVAGTAMTKPEKVKGEVLENEDNHDMRIDDFDLEQATQSLLAKGRALPQTDHAKVYYRSFRKDFYKEVPEITKMSKREVDDYRYELDQIRVRGKDCPKPIKTWAQCGVEWKILNVLKKQNYTKPTPIQAQAIPAIMSGRDVIGIAKTGSGKTLAFLIPMFRHILDQDELEEMDGPIAVIMAPTRELAMQTWKEANKIAKTFDLKVVCVYGGVGISEQIADLKRGAEIVVCTPGRMIDMLAANNGKVTNLRRCTYLVLDEADRMFDMGFEPQVTKIVNNIRPDRQTVLFSATFPRQMEALARKILAQPIEIEVGGKSVVCNDVEQHAVVIEEHQKFLKLLELCGKFYEMGSIIIFVDKQEKTDEIVADLMRSGYNCAPLHGAIDQFDRDSAITDFKAGDMKILVATSVAARGLDVKNLVLVVNYDCPNHYEDYVHRVGRTGRAGNKGWAYTFVLPENQEKMAGEICKAFETAGVTPPAELKAMFEKFKAEMEAQGKKVVLGGRGFAGSGYKYDEAEADAQTTQRRMTKLMHGMEHAQDDDDDDEIDAQLASLMKSKTRVVSGSTSGMSSSQAAKLNQSVESKMDEVRSRAAKVVINKLSTVAQERKDDVTRATEAVLKGNIEPSNIELSAAAKARAKAGQLNEKLNYMGGEAPPEVAMAPEETQYFEEELDINDFPQQVRYRICSREVIGQVCDYAEVGMSVRGTHYPQGKDPKEGDRRLTILLESRSELQLRRAKDEILRIMKETIRQLTTQARQGGPHGRYKVL